jgi:hypothetical protein
MFIRKFGSKREEGTGDWGNYIMGDFITLVLHLLLLGWFKHSKISCTEGGVKSMQNFDRKM